MTHPLGPVMATQFSFLHCFANFSKLDVQITSSISSYITTWINVTFSIIGNHFWYTFHIYVHVKPTSKFKSSNHCLQCICIKPTRKIRDQVELSVTRRNVHQCNWKFCRRYEFLFLTILKKKKQLHLLLLIMVYSSKIYELKVFYPIVNAVSYLKRSKWKLLAGVYPSFIVMLLRL